MIGIRRGDHVAALYKVMHHLDPTVARKLLTGGGIVAKHRLGEIKGNDNGRCLNSKSLRYNNTSIAGYDRDYAATAVDMLITFNGSVFGKLRFTRDFFLPVVEYKESLVKYDIRRIEKVDIRKDGVCIDVMLCIPDSDEDVYYRIICSRGSKFDLKDVCEEYWTDEEEI